MFCFLAWTAIAQATISKKIDFNNDQKDDLVWQEKNYGAIAAWHMNGVAVMRGVEFATPPTLVTPNHMADFDGDGNTDILWTEAGSNITHLWIMNSSGTGPRSSAVLNSGNAFSATHIGDFNDDGKADILWRNNATGEAKISLMNGTNVLATRTIIGTTAWIVVATGDFDGNGTTDLVWRDNITGNTQLWLMNRDGLTVRDAAQFSTTLSWHVKFACDFDGNGTADLLWEHESGVTQSWLLRGLSITAARNLESSGDWMVIKTGDFNGDGKCDLLWQHRQIRTYHLWLMNGTQLITGRELLASDSWKPAGIGDYDGNGKSDLVWVDDYEGHAQIWLMNGLYPAEARQYTNLLTWTPITRSQPTSTFLLGALPPMTKDAARFLTQATFGPTYPEIQQLAATGNYTAWLNNQFALPQRTYTTCIGDLGGDDVYEKFPECFWNYALTAPDQLRQRMAFALSQIFVISANTGPLYEPRSLSNFYDQLYLHAFGNFRTLLERVTLNTSMGVYLNMLGSDGTTVGLLPNENFAREVLQLFSIGLYQLNLDGTLRTDGSGNPIPTYNENTVKGFAKAFTGWGDNDGPTIEDNWPYGRNLEYIWHLPMQAWENHHDRSAKQLLNGYVTPPNQTAATDLRLALDNIFNHPNVGPFIGKQLIQRFVTSNPSPAYVARVASVFNNNGQSVRGDLRAVISAILLDPEARSLANTGNPTFGKLKEPILRYSALLRAFNGRPASGRYKQLAYVDSIEYGIGQQVLLAPSVFNFFRPSYSPPGPIATQRLVAPEFQILNTSTVVSTPNYLASGFIFLRPEYSTSADDVLPQGYSALPNEPRLLLDHLNVLMLAGNMPEWLYNSLLRTLNELSGDPLYQKEIAIHAIDVALGTLQR